MIKKSLPLLCEPEARIRKQQYLKERLQVGDRKAAVNLFYHPRRGGSISSTG